MKTTVRAFALAVAFHRRRLGRAILLIVQFAPDKKNVDSFQVSCCIAKIKSNCKTTEVRLRRLLPTDCVDCSTYRCKGWEQRGHQAAIPNSNCGQLVDRAAAYKLAIKTEANVDEILGKSA